MDHKNELFLINNYFGSRFNQSPKSTIKNNDLSTLEEEVCPEERSV